MPQIWSVSCVLLSWLQGRLDAIVFVSEVSNFLCFQGKFQEAGKLYKKTGNDEKVTRYMQGCVNSFWERGWV